MTLLPPLTVWGSVVAGSRRIERGYMHHTSGWWMGGAGWMGGGMWIWTMIAVLVVVLLAVAINRVSKK